MSPNKRASRLPVANVGHVANDLVREEWRRRVEAEYRSAALAQHLTLWLIQIGASPDLIDLGLRIVKDELSHARLSQRVFEVATRGTVTETGAALSRSALSLSRNESEPLEHDVARACVDIFCLHETVAVPLFHALRKACKVPVARRALDRVLLDEVRHREFGWTLLGWLLDGPHEAALRKLIERELPGMLSRLIESYGESEGRHSIEIDSQTDEMDEETARWGLMPGARYAEIVRRAFERDYVPRFARLGIDARAAYGLAVGPR